MLSKASELTGVSIQAKDGEIGSTTDLLFDDKDWRVRWLVVDTGAWLAGKKVLLPSSKLRRAMPEAAAILADLTREQVKASPEIDTNRPVSRQMETSIYDYYGWAPYWPLGVGARHPAAYPGGGYGPPVGYPPGQARMSEAERLARQGQHSGDPHLRSAEEVTGYYIQGSDDDIGHVEDLLVDDTTWVIRYIIVDTRNWWPGKQVLALPAWIEGIDWNERTVRVGRTRQEIKDAPEFDPNEPVDRGYEESLYGHYGMPGYWR